MAEIKIVSFDAEGTLVTTDFSYAIWFEAIPRSYAERYNMDLEQAAEAVKEEYRKIGDQRLEWYDIKYWFHKLDLGSHEPVMQRYQHKTGFYPDAREVLLSLGQRYELIVASGSPQEFLRYLLRGMESYFTRVFSSISDYKRLKTAEFYKNMCQEMKVQPSQVIHVGDNWQFDVLEPSTIGIRAFYLDRKRQDSRQGSLSTLTQLPEYLPL